MKTFIWFREYEVLAANANTVEEARELLKPKLDALLDPKLESEIELSIRYLKYTNSLNEEPKYYRDQAWWDRAIKNLKESIEDEKGLLSKNPEFIIEENQSIIFDHSNE